MGEEIKNKKYSRVIMSFELDKSRIAASDIAYAFHNYLMEKGFIGTLDKMWVCEVDNGNTYNFPKY